MCLQLGHAWIWTSASARCERRRPFLDLDSLTFGSAMGPGNSTGTFAGEAGLPRGTPSVAGNDWEALRNQTRGDGRSKSGLQPHLGFLAAGCLVRGFRVLGLVGLQRLHPTPHCLQRATEVGLELLELLERVSLGLADDLVALRLRVFDHLR